MSLRSPWCLLPAALLAACSGDGSASVATPTHAPERSEIVFQAVDAGTGEALVDTLMTVRHLVRFPITLDSAAVEQAPSLQPYHIAHRVGADSLVLEVRVEAPSYHRLDTVLSVARGASAGPLTLRMARDLERAARGQTPPPTSSGAPSPARPAATGAAAPGDDAPTADPDAAVDQRPLQAGNRAFQAGDWAAAADAYGRMAPPTRKVGPYAREYAQAMVRLGVSHLNRGEVAAAMEALQTAVTYPAAGYAGYLALGQAQCTAGRLDEGRRTLGLIERAASVRERTTALALAEYQGGVCSYREYQQAKTAIDRVRTGSRAVKELGAFIQEGQAMRAAPRPITTAVADAQAKVAEIRDRLRRGGDRS
jgi:hypothetical protein